MPASLLVARDQPLSPRLRAFLVRFAPAHRGRDSTVSRRLLWAGFEAEDSVVVYAGARAALLVAVPALAVLLLLGRPMPDLVAGIFFALVAAWLLPPGVLQWMSRRRQRRLRRGIVDALDLLVVCVGAGCSIERAIRFVAREVLADHPELATQLDQTARESRRGLARAEALRSVYARTGVAELRLIATTVIQSERLGTDLSEGLRRCAETLRTNRARAAERRAWMAPIKMALVFVSLILMPLLMLGYQLSALGFR